METTLEKMEKTTNNIQVTGIYGWICPVCGRGNSPFTSTCPCKPLEYKTTYSPNYKTIWTTTTTGGTINETR